MKNGEVTMKTKMSLSAEMDLTQDSVVQLTCWCGQIALHELWGLGRTRLDRITRRKELLGSQSLAVVMQPDKNGMPQTEKARRRSPRACRRNSGCLRCGHPAPGGSSS